jgi:ABC-type multidrug transport system fused ATPase/permease subunit
MSDALNRARKLMEARSGTIAAIHALAVVQALLVLALATVIALLLSLADHLGVTRLQPSHLSATHFDQLPAWLRAGLPVREELARVETGGPGLTLTVPETGLYPVVAQTAFDPNPLHQFAGSILGRFIDRVRPLRENQGALISLMIVGLVILLTMGLLARLRHRLAARATLRAASGLRNQIHRQMYRLGQTALPGEGIGPVINLFTRDVNEVRDGLLSDLLHGGLAPVLAAGLIGMALVISAPLAIFLLTLAGLIALAWGPLEQTRRQEADEATGEAAVGLLQLHEDLSMLRTVRVFGMESIDRQRFEEHLEQYHAAEEERLVSIRGGHPWLILAVGAAVILAMGMLCHAVLTGRTEMAGALVTAGLIAALAWPALIWRNRTRTLATADRAARAIVAFLERKPDLQMTVGARFLPPLKQEIQLEHVSVEDVAGRALLEGLSARIPAGSRVAIVSLEEDAKHAIACLIPRLLDPTRGSVLIDSIDLRDVTLESLRAQVALLFQADYVFSDSVMNNIGLGDSSYALPRITEAAKIAHAHHFIQQLPQGYDTIIGPLGHPLPLDQQFRIALARAVLHDPSIVIIEEPDQPLDDDVKHLIDDTLDRMAKGRTLLFLPHRLSTIRKCDLVLVVHNGKLETLGHPRDLHTQSKLYRHIQYLEFNPFAANEFEPGAVG